MKKILLLSLMLCASIISQATNPDEANCGAGRVTALGFDHAPTDCFLKVALFPGLGQAGFQMYINGSVYRDPNTGNTLFSDAVTGFNVPSATVGGITSGKEFDVFTREYCNSDTAGSPTFDSAIVTIFASSDFVCQSPLPPPIQPPCSGRKCPAKQHLNAQCNCVKN